MKAGKNKLGSGIFCILVFVIILITVINLTRAAENDSSNPEKEEYLKKIGVPIGQNDLKAEDFDVGKDKNTLIVKKTAASKIFDVSKIKGKIIFELPDGGGITGRLYTGKEEKKDDTSTGTPLLNRIILGKNSKVTVIDGKIVVENLKLEYGSNVDTAFVEGLFEKYDHETRSLIGKAGEKIKINDFDFTPENSGAMEVSYGSLSTKGKDAVITQNGKYIGKFNGRIDCAWEGGFELIGNSKDPTTFFNEKNTMIKVTAQTLVCIGPECKRGYNGDVIDYRSGDFILSPGIGSDNKIEIEAKDSDYKNIIVRRVYPGEGSTSGIAAHAEEPKEEIKFTINTEKDGKAEKVIIDFSKNMPISQGDLSSLKTNIGNIYQKENELSSWMIYNGAAIKSEKIGRIYAEDPLRALENIKDNEIKKLFLRTVDFYDVEKEGLVNSAEKYVGKDKELQNLFVESLILSQGHHSAVGDYNILKSLFKFTENNPEAGVAIAEGLSSGNMDPTKFRKLLETTKSEPEVQSALVFSYTSNIGAYEAEKMLETLKDNPDYETLKEKISSRTDGILEYEKFRAMTPEDKKETLLKTNFFSPVTLRVAMEACGNNKELQNLAAQRFTQDGSLYLMDTDRIEDIVSLVESVKDNPEAKKSILDFYNSGMYTWDPKRIREIATNLDSEYLATVLDYSSPYFNSDSKRDPGFDADKMAELYNNAGFLDKTNSLDRAERWSIGLTVTRRLEQEGLEFNPENFLKTTEEIILAREANKDRVILGKDTQVFIPITNDEERTLEDFKTTAPVFQEDMLTRLARDSGVSDEAIRTGLRGPGSKDTILDAIENSKGDTTIAFEGHGGPEHLWLGKGTVGSERSDNMNNPSAISYVELGDRLIARARSGESLSGVNIMLDSCFSYDFTKNLYSYLQENGAGNVKDYPTILTVTNRGQYGYSNFKDNGIRYADTDLTINSPYLLGVYKSKNPGEELTLNNIYRSEKYYFRQEDNAIFIPDKNKVVPIGSSFDWLFENPFKILDTPEKKNPLKEPVIPSIIEIGKTDFTTGELFA